MTGGLHGGSAKFKGFQSPKDGEGGVSSRGEVYKNENEYYSVLKRNRLSSQEKTWRALLTLKRDYPSRVSSFLEIRTTLPANKSKQLCTFHSKPATMSLRVLGHHPAALTTPEQVPDTAAQS